jgi:hypothetical protein
MGLVKMFANPSSTLHSLGQHSSPYQQGCLRSCFCVHCKIYKEAGCCCCCCLKSISAHTQKFPSARDFHCMIWCPQYAKIDPLVYRQRERKTQSTVWTMTTWMKRSVYRPYRWSLPLLQNPKSPIDSVVRRQQRQTFDWKQEIVHSLTVRYGVSIEYFLDQPWLK